MIELKNINKSFGEKQVLKNINITCEPGKCNLIIGASGGGKSVTLKNMVGLLEPDSVYNLGLSPKRCLLNNGAYIRSVLRNGNLKFTTSSKNKEVVSGGVTEKEDVVIITLDSPFFKPF